MKKSEYLSRCSKEPDLIRLTDIIWVNMNFEYPEQFEKVLINIFTKWMNMSYNLNYKSYD
jgi:hypothetical protein